MSEVKRWNHTTVHQNSDDVESAMITNSNGGYVTYGAFLGMEKRAEAAEAENSYMGGGARYWHDEYCAQQHRLVAKIVDLEAKLADMEKLEPVVEVSVDGRATDDYTFTINKSLPNGVRELFTHPAPAVSLAELVPEGWKLVPIQPDALMVEEWRNDMSNSYASQYTENIGEDEIVFAYQAMLSVAPEPEILRNIEEANK